MITKTSGAYSSERRRVYSTKAISRMTDVDNRKNWTPSTRPPQRKGAPPAPQRFQIVKSLGSRECRLDLVDEDLANLAFSELELANSGVSRDGCCFIGSKDKLQPVLDFARLFTSVELPECVADVKTDVGVICADLVKSGLLKLSSENLVSGCETLIQGLVANLSKLSDTSPKAALALFSRCSIRTQVAILANEHSPTFVKTLEGDVDFERVLAAAARSVTKQSDSQMLKRILTSCPLFARSHVLQMLASKCPDKVALLCTADSDLARLMLDMLPSDNNPPDALTTLQSRLAQLPKGSLSRPRGSKQPRNVDQGGYERLKRCDWLTVTPSGTLHLDNVPSRWDIPVEDVIELMMSEPDDAMQLAHDLLAGFAGAVKRSSHAHWTTPHAMQVWCALQEHVHQLLTAGDPVAALAKEVIEKFRKRLVKAWVGLDSMARASAFSTLLEDLDGRELAACRTFLLGSGMQIDSMLDQWFKERLGAAFRAGSGAEGLAEMRHCGVLGVALAQGARNTGSFVRDALTWVVQGPPLWAERSDMLKAFLVMLEEADPQVFEKLAIINTTDSQLIVQIHPDEQQEVVSGPLAEKIRSLMQERWWEIHSASMFSSDPNVAALEKLQHREEESVDPIKDLMRMMLPSASAQGDWVELLRDGALNLAKVQSSEEAAPYLRQIANALASAPPDYSPSLEVRTAMTTYLDSLIQARKWTGLSACCETFRPRDGGNANGQILLGELLGKLATSEWENSKKQILETANVLASFLNSGPIAPAAMEQFTYISQPILGSLQCAILWRDADALFTDAGKQARYVWVDSTLARIDLNLAPASVIRRQDILRKCPKPQFSNNI